MKFIFLLLTLTLICSLTAAETYLTPLDFGLSLMDHGMVDYVNSPPNILVANFSSDDYPDIARFEGNTLEIFIFQGLGYTQEPQSSRTFDQPIQSLRLDDDIWDGIDDLVVTFTDGSEETLLHRGGCLDLKGGRETTGVSRPSYTDKRAEIPRRVSEADFEIVWESEPRPYGMDRCAVGDLDNDGIIELVTWYKESHYADSAFFLIYKSIGDDEYELFMEERFYVDPPGNPVATAILIADMDRNGLKELIYTLDRVYIWEFSGPGEYTYWNCSINFSRAVEDVEVCDVDQDSILELAFVTSNYGMQPPTMYQVEEFGAKSPYPWHSYVFNGIWTAWQDWEDDRLAVGDFDNDGAVDIVSGNFASVWNYDPVDIQFYRYDSSGPPYFIQNWLHTGIPLSCTTPVIADLDEDGQNELFAGGLSPNGGSAYVWEATGLGTGRVAWLDTTSAPTGPNEATFGLIDYNPSVVTIHILPRYPDDSQLLLWSLVENNYFNLWSSPEMDTIAYHNHSIIDIDMDGKQNIIVGGPRAGYTPNRVDDWEQTSAGIRENPHLSTPEAFRFYQNYPNPFNSKTLITYVLEKKSDVLLSIWDLQGKKVFQKLEKEEMPGRYAVNWNAQGLTSGIYLICLETESNRQIKKAVLLK